MCRQSEDLIKEPPSVVSEENQMFQYTSDVKSENLQNNIEDMRLFFEEFREQLTSGISIEISSATDNISHEIMKSKLELGACVENGMRKLESKLDKHFENVDKDIGAWRDRNRKNIFRKMLTKAFKF